MEADDRRGIGEGRPGDLGLERWRAVPAAIEIEPDRQIGPTGTQLGQRLDHDVQLIGGREGPGVDEAQDAIGHERALREPPGVEAGEVGRVAHDVDLVGRDADVTEPLGEGVVDRDGSAGGGEREPLLEPERHLRGRARGAREACPEELGHRLVQVEDHRDAGQPEVQRPEHQEVGQGVDLDERIPAPPVGLRDGRRRAYQEVEVLDEVGPQARALVALDVEAVDADAIDDRICRVVLAAERVDVDGPAGTDERLGFAADPRILVVVGVGQHRHGSRHRVERSRGSPGFSATRWLKRGHLPLPSAMGAERRARGGSPSRTSNRVADTKESARAREAPAPEYRAGRCNAASGRPRPPESGQIPPRYRSQRCAAGTCRVPAARSISGRNRRRASAADAPAATRRCLSNS